MLKQWRERRRAKRERLEAWKRRTALTPEQLAAMALASALEGAENSGAETLASRIAAMSSKDRYRLALLAEGLTRKDIALYEFRDEQDVEQDLTRIRANLRGEHAL